MGEYGREQRNKLSRTVDGNGLTNEQVNKFIDNSSSSINQAGRIYTIMQMSRGNTIKRCIGSSNNTIQCSLLDLLLLTRLTDAPVMQSPHHRHSHHRPSNRIQHRRERKKQYNLRKRRRKQRENIIKKIYGEQEKIDHVPQEYLSYQDNEEGRRRRSLAHVLNPNTPKDKRDYKITINPNNPLGTNNTNENLTEMALVHEKTHIISDIVYSMNDSKGEMGIFHHKEGVDDMTHFSEQRDLMEMRIKMLIAILQKDNDLTVKQKMHFKSRAEYPYCSPNEYDPVINELLVYTKLYKIPANSKTVIALVQLGNENYRRRNEGKHFEGEWPS